MMMTTDLRELAEADRQAVAQFRARKMGITRGSDSSNRDAIVCDDMVINTGRSGLLEMLIVAALAFGAAWWFFGRESNAAPQQPTPLEDSEYEVRFFDKDGNQITVPRLPK